MDTKHRHLEYLPVAELEPAPRNPRTHSSRQIAQIAESIRKFGFTNPVLIGPDKDIVAGHGRVDAAKRLQIDNVPTICLDDLTPAQLRAYAIADNKLAENAGWDQDLLALELNYITELDVSLDLTLTGFETAEIDLLVCPGAPPPEDPDDEVPSPAPDQASITQLGDLWQLGAHRILCADATENASYDQLLGSEQAELVFTDPPYNVPIQGHVSGLGDIKHREFAMASGEMSVREFTEFLETVLEALTRHSVDGSIHFICMDWRHILELMTAGQSVYSELKNLCVWNKSNGGMGSLYRSKHELIFVFKNGRQPHINNVQLGQYGRYRTNVWDYPGANTIREGRLDELAMHPTVKPIALVADAIRDCSERGSLVLDCFGGSGTTLLAAEHTQRQACLMELDPLYVDITIRRFQKLTGQEAIHINSGRSFADIAVERSSAEPESSNDTLREV